MMVIFPLPAALCRVALCRRVACCQVFPDGSRYEGQWKDGLKHGKARGNLVSYRCCCCCCCLLLLLLFLFGVVASAQACTVLEECLFCISAVFLFQ